MREFKMSFEKATADFLAIGMLPKAANCLEALGEYIKAAGTYPPSIFWYLRVPINLSLRNMVQATGISTRGGALRTCGDIIYSTSCGGIL